MSQVKILRQPASADFWVLSTYFYRRFSTFCCINLIQQVEKTQKSAEAGCLNFKLAQKINTKYAKISILEMFHLNAISCLKWTYKVAKVIESCAQGPENLESALLGKAVKKLCSDQIDPIIFAKNQQGKLITTVTQCRPENTHREFQPSNRNELWPKSPPFHAKVERVNRPHH